MLKSPFLAGSQNSRGPISLPRELLLHDRIVEMSRMPEKKSHNDWLSFEARAVKSVKDWWEFKDWSETLVILYYQQCISHLIRFLPPFCSKGSATVSFLYGSSDC